MKKLVDIVVVVRVTTAIRIIHEANFGHTFSKLKQLLFYEKMVRHDQCIQVDFSIEVERAVEATEDSLCFLTQGD